MNQQLKDKIETKGIRHSYPMYKSITKNEPISLMDYTAINDMFNQYLARRILEGDTITLPARLGTIGIVGRVQTITFDENNNIKGLAPDYASTKKLWETNPEAKRLKKILYHLNEHTSNIRYKFLWSKRNVLVANKTLYSLAMSRENKRDLSKLLKQGKEYHNE